MWVDPRNFRLGATLTLTPSLFLFSISLLHLTLHPLHTHPPLSSPETGGGGQEKPAPAGEPGEGAETPPEAAVQPQSVRGPGVHGHSELHVGLLRPLRGF